MPISRATKKQTLQALMCQLQVLWGAGVEQLAHDRQLAQQVLFTTICRSCASSAIPCSKSVCGHPTCRDSACVVAQMKHTLAHQHAETRRLYCRYSAHWRQEGFSWFLLGGRGA